MKKAVLLITFLLFALNGFSQADIKVVNSDYKDYFVPGTTHTYTITVVNLGPLPATNVSISNAIPNGITSGFSWTGPNGKSGINNPVSDLITSMPVGQALTYTVTFPVPLTFNGNSLVNTVLVTSQTTDPNPTCDQCSDTDTRATNADIVVTNTDGKDYYTPGTNSVYTVKVKNNGPLDATNVKVSNPIPAGVSLFSWTGSNSTSGTNVPLNNTISLLKAGETVTYTITLQVPAGQTTPLTSQASATTTTAETDTVNNIAGDTDTLLSGADIVVTNSDGKTLYTPGTQNTYTVKVVNNGPQAAANVHVSNAIPANIPPASFSWTGSNGASGTGADLDDTITNLAVGSTITYTINVQVPGSYTGNLVSTTNVTSDTSDPFPTCDQCVDTDVQSNGADIVIVNTDNSDIYTAGTTTKYTVKVTNNGPATATNVVIQEQVPAGIQPTDFSWSGNGTAGTGALNNTITSLPVGQSVTYTVTVNIPANFTGDLISQVTYSSATIDPDPTCNQCTDVDKVKSGVVVTNTNGQTEYIAGKTITYTVTVTNYDAVAATNIAVQDLVSAGIPPANVTWTGSNGSSGTGNLVNTISSLGQNQKVTYTITVKVPSSYDQKANLVNEVTYTINGSPSPTVCTQCTDIDTPTPFADLQIVKTDNQTQFLLNSTNTYTIVVANNGASDSNNVVVVDKVPTGIAPSSMTWSGSNGTSGTGELNDVIATLPAGQVVTYIVSIKIGATYNPPDPANPGSSLVNLVNKVEVTSDTPDPTPSCPGCTDTDTPRPDSVSIAINEKNDPNYTENLVKNILINSPCVVTSNFKSTASCGFGYFHRNNSDFPIKEGMVIRNGQVKNGEGKYTGQGGSSNCSNVGDSELQAINCKAGNCGAITDASSVEFRFVSGGSKFSFNYLFASNEYGVYQCEYSDAFAFILTDVTDPLKPGPAVNLAVVPNPNGTNPATVPASVTNIRKKIHNPTCGDANPNLFGQLNSSPASAIAASDINMVGQTVKLTAQSDVIPGHTYRIKLVVGDYRDALYDSAVFIEAGSFVIGQPTIVSDNGVTDNLPLCQGTTHTLKTGDSKLPGITYSWQRNGVTIPGADTYFIEVNQDGVYSVTYTYNSTGCTQTDDYTVNYVADQPLQEPNDLTRCEGAGNIFDLTVNEAVVLGGLNPGDYTIVYYKSQADADSFSNAIPNPKAYPGTNNESIYMKVEYLLATSDCIPTKIFKLLFTPGASGTFQYVDDGGAAGFCRNSSTSLKATKSATFTEGGIYSVTPTTGLTIDASTGTLDLTNAVPGDYVVNYNVPAANGCLEYNTTAPVKITACVTTTMNPIDQICAGDSSAIVTLTSTDAGPGVVYTWSDATGVLGTTTVPSFTLPTVPTAAGNYKYTVVVSYGTEVSAPSSQDLVVNASPEAFIAAPSSVCSGQSTTVTFTGTPGAKVTYNDGTTSSTIQLSAVGTYSLTTPILTANITYTLESVERNTVPSCLQNIPPTAANSSVTITSIDAPQATVSNGSASQICMGEATDIVFNGTPGAIVAYTANETPQTITLNASGEPTIVSTGILNEDTVYQIESVTAGEAGCVTYGGNSITVDVVIIPEPTMKQKGYICVDPTTGDTTRTFRLDTGLDPSLYTFEWFYQANGQAEVALGTTDSFYDADKVGQYKVVVTDNGPLACQRTAVATVLQSVPPVAVVGEVVTSYFDDNQTVVVTASPMSPDTTYEYQLDYGPFQDSNIFTNVSYGTHVVRARDKQACDTKESTVTVINYPKYFTPNGDGYNDEWNISVLNNQPNSKIYIFDRFGKLLKQISPTGAGWDGTYNGHQMPADDYWFVVQYQEQLINKEFRSHFSLKR